MDVKLKSGWQEITLPRYHDIKGIYEPMLLNDLEKEIKVLAIALRIDDKELNKMSIPELKTLFKSDSRLVEELKGSFQLRKVSTCERRCNLFTRTWFYQKSKRSGCIPFE